MSKTPPVNFVRISEEGPREGFQSHPPGIPTSAKVELIEALAEAGLTEIACCSFVSQTQVPQMADAEQIVASIRRRPDVRYTGLWLNSRGFARATARGVDLRPTLVTSASETFGLRNNQRDRKHLLDGQRELAVAYRASGLSSAMGYVFTAFGCNYEGAISALQVVSSVGDIVAVAQESGVSLEAVYLCDTIGSATPGSVRVALDAVREAHPGLELALHLHDTRGLALANALVGLRSGVRRFDASIAGLGGCPFAGNTAAAGNICTEDLAYLCEVEGLDTGVDLDQLIRCGMLAERIVGRPLPGKLKNSGHFRRHRAEALAA